MRMVLALCVLVLMSLTCPVTGAQSPEGASSSTVKQGQRKHPRKRRATPQRVSPAKPVPQGVATGGRQSSLAPVSMTPEQAKALAGGASVMTQAVTQDVREWQTAWQAISPNDQATLTATAKSAVESLRNLTPEQRDQMTQAAEEMAEALAASSPQQQDVLQQRLERSAKAYASMTPEQQQVFLEQTADAIEQMEQLTPQQKAQLKAYYRAQVGR